MNIKRITHQLRSADASEIAEAAMVLPLVLMLLLGIIWFGRAFNIYSTIQQAAQQGAITAARATCATCLCPTGNTCPPDATVDGVVDAVMQASSLDPSQIPVNSNPPTPLSCAGTGLPVPCSTTANITICRQALLNSSTSSTQAPQCGIVVGFQYPFQLNLPFTSLNMQQIILSAEAQSRMEN